MFRKSKVNFKKKTVDIIWIFVLLWQLYVECTTARDKRDCLCLCTAVASTFFETILTVELIFIFLSPIKIQ